MATDRLAGCDRSPSASSTRVRRRTPVRSSAGSPTRGRGLAERHRIGFVAAGADDVRVVTGSPDDTPFGRRLRDLVRTDRPAGGLVVLGSGAIPLATLRDRRAFVAAAGVDDRRALANNRYSADVVAVARAAEGLAAVPDLPGDNALPRWLAETAGYAVTDLARRWRLGDRPRQPASTWC